MAWDDMDMWWMNEPRKSNLPELAVGAFLQGRQMAQRKAEFDAELPMKVAESNARTAANVAQMNIATKRADREVAEWERTDREEPVLQDYSRQIATWYSDPLSKGEIPVTPNGLTGENLAKANKLMLDASIAKRVQVANSEVGMARAKEMEDMASLIASGYLDESKAADTEARKLARINRAGREAQTVAEKMGIRNMPMTNVPTLPNGNLDVANWQYTLEQFKPQAAIPSGMVPTKMVVNGVTYEAPAPEKAKETKDEYIRRVSADVIAKGLPAEQAATEAARIWDISTGATPSAPSAPIEITEETADELWDNAPAGTKFIPNKTFKLSDGGEMVAGRVYTKLSEDIVKQKRADQLIERRNELRSDIRVESKPGPFNEVVTPEQLASEFFGGKADRTRASTFDAPQGSNAVRTRKRTPEDAARLKKMQDELTAIEQELKTLQK